MIAIDKQRIENGDTVVGYSVRGICRWEIILGAECYS